MPRILDITVVTCHFVVAVLGTVFFLQPSMAPRLTTLEAPSPTVLAEPKNFPLWKVFDQSNAKKVARNDGLLACSSFPYVCA